MGKINDFGFPFTSVTGDRQYSASEWRDYFESLMTNGVVTYTTNELIVKQQAVANKTIYVDLGSMLINGTMRILDTTQNVTIADNTSGNPRIDRIVARLNYTDRKIEFGVLTGTPAGSPVAPTLTRNTTVWELSLARIAVANGFSTIVTANITDERSNDAVCGFMEYKDRILSDRMDNLEANALVPAGTVISFSGATAPTGYLQCNGSAISRTTYANLFSAISTLYGAGNGTTTFNIPELRGEFIRGLDSGRGVDTGRAIGTPQSATQFLQANVGVVNPSNYDTLANGTSGISFNSSASTGTSRITVPTRPRNIAMMYCIKI